MEYDVKVKNRLKRLEGQLRGVYRMMEEGQDCKEVVSQMAAVRNGIDKTMAVVVSQNLEKCVREQMATGEETNKVIEEAVNLLVKSR